MTTLCLPSTEAVALVGALPAEIDVVIWNGEDAPAELADVDFLTRYGGPPLPRTVLARLPKLKVLQVLAAGVENWHGHVPQGVTLCSGRGIHGASTAELAIAGMLSLLRELPRFAREQRDHVWSHQFTDCLVEKRVLVLGAGDIGTRIAAIAEILGADVTRVARTARPGVVGIDDVPALLPTQDVVAIAVPQTPATAGLVDAAFLAALPDGAILVNVARGCIVDTDALTKELMARRLRAFLDVVDPEPLPPEHPLWEAPNLLLTSHIGGGANGWRPRAFRLVHDQVLRWHVGEPLHNVVDHAV